MYNLCINLKKIISFPLLKILHYFGYNGFPLYYQPDGGMGSHKKYLKFILGSLNVEIPIIIEAGSGDNSTGVFTNYSKNKKFTFYSFENNKEWHKKMSKKFKNTNSKFIYLDDELYSEIRTHILNDGIEKIDLTFIDSGPWNSRTNVKNLLTDLSNIVCIHDADYFPHANLWGNEIKPIKKRSKNKYFYGKLIKENLGLRNYDSEFTYWVEIFPSRPGYFTGPPLLVGSNFIDVRKIFNEGKPDGIYIFSQ